MVEKKDETKAAKSAEWKAVKLVDAMEKKLAES